MTHEEVGLYRLLNSLNYLVDPRIGIIRYLKENPSDTGSPKLFHYDAGASDTRAFTGQSNFKRSGGVSSARSTAIAKAIGEGVERYCSAIYSREEFPLFSYSNAPVRCCDPETFALFSQNQYASENFNYIPFACDTVVRWTPAFDLTDNLPRYVPACAVYIPYEFKAGEEAEILQPISTGLACHSSPTLAAISGICEVIERDAFTLTWQCKLRKPRIEHDSLSPSNKAIVRLFENAGYRISLLDITTDISVPVVLAVSQSSRHDNPPLVAAASASLSPEIAVRKSLEELEHTREYVQHIKSEVPRLARIENFENVHYQADHLNFWCDESNLKYADFLFEGPSVSFAELKDLSSDSDVANLKTLRNLISARGLRILLCDLTTSDVKEIGLSVVRSVIPGMHPLVVGHKYRALGGHRIRAIESSLEPWQRVEIVREAAPHPYP